MKYRLIEWRGEVYVVVGIGYDVTRDPPDVYHCYLLEHSLLRTSLQSKWPTIISFSEAVEITDKKKIQTIWILYGE
jgi:hypothetical protein